MLFSLPENETIDDAVFTYSGSLFLYPSRHEENYNIGFGGSLYVLSYGKSFRKFWVSLNQTSCRAKSVFWFVLVAVLPLVPGQRHGRPLVRQRTIPVGTPLDAFSSFPYLLLSAICRCSTSVTYGKTLPSSSPETQNKHTLPFFPRKRCLSRALSLSTCVLCLCLYRRTGLRTSKDKKHNSLLVHGNAKACTSRIRFKLRLFYE